MDEKLPELLGRSVESDEVRSFIALYDPNARIEAEDDRYYCSLNHHGVELLFDEEKILKAVFLFGPAGQEDMLPFRGELPHGIDFSMRRESVHEHMGMADVSGGAESLLGSWIPPWDKYYFDGYSLHLTYANNLESIRTFTIQVDHEDHRGHKRPEKDPLSWWIESGMTFEDQPELQVSDLVDIYLEKMPASGLKGLMLVRKELGLEIGVGKLKALAGELPVLLLEELPYGSSSRQCKELNQQVDCLRMRRHGSPKTASGFC